jgi:GTPase SAR1 family protein
LRDKKTGEVIVLFGGKGAGKSTFLRKLLYHKPPQFLSKYSRVAIADLLNTPEDEREIHKSIWTQIVNNLDVDELLKGDRNQLLSLFETKYVIATKQSLFGLDKESENFNIKLNELVNQWIDDRKYVAKCLVEYWRLKHKGCVVVVDNTDQLPHKLQDLCFTTAQEVADHLGCLVIISMREERFHSSRIHGTLDAYQNSGFHISSPVTQAVFEKRINYVIQKLDDDSFCLSELGCNSTAPAADAIKKLFFILKNEFKKGNNSPLTDFLTACAHGNIRMALELFRDFVKSGYTNVGEMVASQTLWNLKTHQVLKPVMIPYRFFYDESQSAIPNIFQIRDKTNGSHFTGMRLLSKLSDGIDLANPFYLSIGQLKEYFSENFNMVDDFEKNLDIFLKCDLVESNNRLDFYCDEVDSVRITTYGLYIFNNLTSFFTYIELVSSDCGIFNEGSANDIVSFSNDDFRYFNQRNRLDRVKARLKKATVFLDYLEKEEQYELELFGDNSEKFIPKIRAAFDIEQKEVMRSACRSKNR